MKKLIFRTIHGLTLILCLTGGIYAQSMAKTHDELSTRQKSMIPIASLTATGDLEPLKSALNEGLDAGLTINEIKEVIVHLYAYCGFPRSIRGLQTFMEVLEERNARGIHDEMGPEASPIHDDRSKYERGKNNLEKLTGRSLNGPQRGYAAFAPVIERFLKEHLFADLFDRDVLTFAERELVTVSVLSSIGGVEPMLRSHLGICLYQGYTPQQLQEFMDIIESTAGVQKAEAARAVLDELLKRRQQN